MELRITLPSQETEKYVFQVLIHIGIGIGIFLLEPLAKVYFFALMGYFLFKIIMAPEAKKTQVILLGCAYFCGVEVLFRMTKGGLSYEASKYLVILFVVMGMFYKGISGRGWPYFMYLILLVPGVLIASTSMSFDTNFRTRVAFVLSGPVCLGLASLFFYDRKVTYKQIVEVIHYLALPCITTATYLFLYNPSIKEVLSGTQSNFATSGGFGPNQVSTALGLGMFAIVVRIFLKSPSLFLKLFNLAILGAIAYRGIVTFSRGGVFAAIIVISAFLWLLFFKSNSRQRNNIIGVIILLVGVIFITWNISSNQSYGLIDKRYTNKDVLGREKEDITTGRLRLFLEELEGFADNPFLGIGAGRVTDIRIVEFNNPLPSHNEVGRLLSEHGIFGLMALTILLIKPLAYRSSNKKNVFFYAFFCFWFATINHSGTRIAAPSFLYALSLLNIMYEDPTIHRKQLKSQEK